MSSCDSSRGGRWVGRGAMRCAVGKRGRVGVWAVAQSKQQRLPNRDMYANVWLPIRCPSALQPLGPIISDNSELRRAYACWTPLVRRRPSSLLSHTPLQGISPMRIPRALVRVSCPRPRLPVHDGALLRYLSCVLRLTRRNLAPSHGSRRADLGPLS